MATATATRKDIAMPNKTVRSVNDWVECSFRRWMRRAAFYCLINGYISAIAAVHSMLALWGRNHGESMELVAVYAASVIRMIVPILFFEALIAMKVPRISAEQPRDDTSFKTLCRVLVTIFVFNSAFDVMFMKYIVPALGGLGEDSGDYLGEFLSFIPKSFTGEMVFDFFHYWGHRMCHQNKFLFAIHSHHHDHVHCGPRSGMDIHPADFFLTNVIPASIALLVCNALVGGFTEWQWHLFLSYKTATEIGGHSGLNYNAMSFPQFPILQWHFADIPLSVADHEWHHVKPTKNFAKRFAVWDRLFGTYEEHKASQKTKKLR